MDLQTPDIRQSPTRLRRRPLAAALIAVAQAAMLAGLLAGTPRTYLPFGQTIVVAAVAAGVALVLAEALGPGAWGVVCAAAASASGWLFAFMASSSLGLVGEPRARLLVVSVLAATWCGPFLAAWAGEGGAPRADALALAALAGWPVLLASAGGALLGDVWSLVGVIALVAGCGALVAFQRVRLRRRSRGEAAGALHPAASGYQVEHHILLAIFAGLQTILLPVLLGATWLGGPLRRRGEATPADIHWAVLAIGAVAWLLLWVAARPTRRRAAARGRKCIPCGPPIRDEMPDHPAPPLPWDTWPPTPIPATPRADFPRAISPAPSPAEPTRRSVGWVLVAASAQFVLCIELAVFLQRVYGRIPGLTELMLLATVTMMLVVAVAASVAPLLGRGRFGVVSVVYSLAVMTGLSAVLVRLWLRQMAF